MKYQAFMAGRPQWARPLAEPTASELAARLARDTGRKVELREHPGGELVCTWDLGKHNRKVDQ
jgi:hypothetical protein